MKALDMKALFNKQNMKKAGVRTAGTLAIPVVFTVIVLIVCAANGTMVMTSMAHFSDFSSYTAIIMLTTFALSINLGSGRFDFSLGAMATLSAAVSSKVTFAMLGGNAATPAVMIIFCLLFGAVFGLVSGALYVLIKIPPIITSLGVTLIYEGISFAISGGMNITKEIQCKSMMGFKDQWYLYWIIILVALALIYFIYDRTKFGYNYKALRDGQKISVNTGIKEIPNAIVCYAIAGALMGMVGFIQSTRSLNVAAGVLNFGSIGIMFTAFLPMFIGGYIGRFSNDKVGYLLAAISMSLLNSMFLRIAAKIDSSVSSIVSGVLLVVFLIYLNNEQTCKDLVTGKLFKKWYIAIKTKLQERKEAKGV